MGNSVTFYRGIMIIKDFRSKYNFNEFDENYYLCIYDLNDNFLYQFESLENATQLLNIQTKDLLRRIRNKQNIILNNQKVKLYLYKKFNIEEKGIQRCIR